jgi:uncharacterized membrane protein HdeD (DUF308 family)
VLSPWILLAGRAALALILGLAITFTAGHTATFGLVAFGIFAVLSGLLVLAAYVGPRTPAEARTPFRAAGIVSIVAGVAALAVPGGGIGYLVWVLSGWAIVTGALELVSGIRYRGRAAGSPDWITVGALTVLLGAVALVIPPDISDAFSGDKGVEGLLTSPIIVVGMLGAWAVITGVLQAIAAASPNRPGARKPARPAGPATASGTASTGGAA